MKKANWHSQWSNASLWSASHHQCYPKTSIHYLLKEWSWRLNRNKIRKILNFNSKPWCDKFKVKEEICEVRKKFVFWAWEDLQASTAVQLEFSNHFHRCHFDSLKRPTQSSLKSKWKSQDLHSDKQSQQQVWISRKYALKLGKLKVRIVRQNDVFVVILDLPK